MHTYTPPAGMTIENACKVVAALACEADEAITLNFTGVVGNIPFIVDPCRVRFCADRADAIDALAAHALSDYHDLKRALEDDDYPTADDLEEDQDERAVYILELADRADKLGIDVAALLERALAQCAAPATCQRCGSALTADGRCVDLTCPYSDRQQTDTFTEG